MSISYCFCLFLTAILEDRGSERREGKASLSVLFVFIIYIGKGKEGSVEERREQELSLGIGVHLLFSK